MRTFISIIICFVFLISANGQTVDSFVTSDGETLHFTKIGEGPRLVLLGGGPGQAVSFVKPWADSLSNKYECILFDQRGTGLSSNVKLDSTTINLERAIQDLEDLRLHLNEDQLIICGVSWGGMLAQSYAAFYPDNTKKMVLISTFGPDLSILPIIDDNMHMRRYPNEKDSLTYWNNQPDSELSKLKKYVYSFMPYFYDHSSGVKIITEMMNSCPMSETVNNLMWKDLVSNYNLTSSLTNYKGECIIIRPRQDIIVVEAVFQIKDILPQTKIIFIEKSGHLVSVEQPEEFFRILKKIL